jgi:hypothetical protein
MSVLRNLESRIADLVEGSFSRAFRTEVRPVEIARRLAREMEQNKTVSVSRTYAPNEYVVWLSRQDRKRFADYEDALANELAGHLLEHSRRERLALLSQPRIEFETDERLRLGEFGIQARLVQPPEDASAPAVQGDHGHTMVYTAQRIRDEVDHATSPPSEAARRRALVLVDGKRMVVGPNGSVIGRSRESDIVVADSNVSRRHAEIRPTAGGWMINDLGSTNGVAVNGHAIEGPHPLEPGDRLLLGTASLTFELE